jgi:hypothetical protein
MSQQGVSQDVLAERLAKIPPIVDMDSHVVEPPHVWSDRLPAPLREAGPRIEYAPRGQVRLIDGSGTRTPQTSADAPGAVGGTIIFGNSVASMADFMFSGVLHRFPGLRLLYAEAQIGWIPYLLERIDDVWETHSGWSRSKDNCPEPPSAYYYRQITSCFFKDAVGWSRSAWTT